MASPQRDKANDLFTALGHPLRRRVLRKMIRQGGDLSPLELAAGLSEPLSALSYHVRVLAECKAVKLVRTEKVRGSTQHFYRPAVRSKWARSALATTRDPAKKNQSAGGEKG